MTAAPRRRRLPQAIRWLHTYVSMAAFLATLAFAVTGLTLNHANWFEAGAPTARSWTGTVAPALVNGPPPALAAELRARHGLHGELRDVSVEDDAVLLVWKGPAYSADATVQRSDGQYEIEEQRRGWVALLDDLHKGRDCGTKWSVLIDAAAVVLAAVAVTGLWLLLYLNKRRRSGLLVAAAGAAVLVLGFWWGVA